MICISQITLNVYVIILEFIYNNRTNNFRLAA